jgi:hypothetical protein
MLAEQVQDPVLKPNTTKKKKERKKRIKAMF